MKRITKLVGISALAIWALAACGGTDAPLEPDEPGVLILTRAQAAERKATLQAQSVTCTDSYSVCRVGRCELPIDDFQYYTQTCCDATGHCTTTQMKICGCVYP